MNDLTFEDPKKKFCDELKAAREFRNLELSRVAERSKISLVYLQHLEDGEWDFLPIAYIRAFLRTYATIVGMNVGEVLEQFDNIVGVPPTPIPVQPAGEERERGYTVKPGRASKRFPTRAGKGGRSGLTFTLDGESVSALSRKLPGRPEYWLAGAGAVVLVVLLLLFWPKGTKKTEEIPFDQVVQEHEQMVEEAGAAAGGVEGVQAGPGETGAPVAPGAPASTARLHLVAESIDTCYIRINADGGETPVADVVLIPGMSRSYEADSLFVVVLGNAGGMRLKLNGLDLGELGEKGRVVTVTLGPEGIRRLRRGVRKAPPPEPQDTTLLPRTDPEELIRPSGTPRTDSR